MIKRVLLFLLLNFSALAIGGLFTGSGVSSVWYQSLNQAPWTPPGWVFGFMWTLIMVCYSFYMALILKDKQNQKKAIGLFSIQWILNVSWNPLFFKYHAVAISLIVIASLTLLVIYFLLHYRKSLNYKSLLIAPYAIWLLIATSLNAYILIYN